MRQPLAQVGRGSRGISWAPVLFLLAFLVAIAVMALFFLEPLLRMANEASPEERRRLGAYGLLAICVLILILLGGLILTLRIGRRLAGIGGEKKGKPTVYLDAWSEAAKRMKVPAADDLEDPNSRDVEKPKED